MAPWSLASDGQCQAHRSLAEILAAKRDGLRPGMTVERAADVIFTLASPEVYLLLTAERGWSPEQWQDWVTAAIAQAVLRQARPASAG